MPENLDSTTLLDRAPDYLPDRGVLSEYPHPTRVDVKRREFIQAKYPGAEFFGRFNQETGKFEIVPSWHPLATVSMILASRNYGHEWFEGHKVVGQHSETGELRSANVILHEARMARFLRSANSIGMGHLLTPEIMRRVDQVTLDLAAVTGSQILDSRSESGDFLTGYIRPMGFRVSSLGVSPKPGDTIDMGVYVMSMGPYLEREAYENGARAVAFLDFVRDSEIRGKVAGNYSHAGEIGTRARGMKMHEAALYGPYWVDKSGKPQPLSLNKNEREEQLATGGSWVDGPGEDIIYFGKDRTVYYSPKSANILSGTTLTHFITDFLPSLGIRTEERIISVRDFRSGFVVGMAYLGNAADYCPSREGTVCRANGEVVEVFNFDITPDMRRISQARKEMLAGQLEAPSGFFTPVDLKAGAEVNAYYKDIYSTWFSS